MKADDGSKTKSTNSFDGVKIVYEVRGKGETSVLFIHGGFADRTFWKHQVNYFSKKYRIIALDLAGHGESGRNRKKWNVFTFAEDAKAVIEAEKLERVVLVGNSLGGPVALETTQLLPQKVVAIVAVDTFQDIDREVPGDYYSQQAKAFTADFTGTLKKMVGMLFHKDVNKGLYDWVEKRMLLAFAGFAAPLMESYEDYDMAATAKKISQPIRCINGDLNPTAVKKNQGVHSDFDAVILEHTGHYPMLERPDQFNRHLEKLLLEFSKKRQE